jgi:hypothetical protein
VDDAKPRLGRLLRERARRRGCAPHDVVETTAPTSRSPNDSYARWSPGKHGRPQAQRSTAKSGFSLSTLEPPPITLAATAIPRIGIARHRRFCAGFERQTAWRYRVFPSRDRGQWAYACRGGSVFGPRRVDHGERLSHRPKR